MTLSTRECPVGEPIINHVKTVVENEYTNYEIQVDLVWEPQWTPSLINDDGKAALNR